MEQAELETGVTEIVRDLAEDDTLVLDTATTAADLPGWDSFDQVNFVVALEDRFHVVLPLIEVERWRNIGDTLESLRRKIVADDRWSEVPDPLTT